MIYTRWTHFAYTTFDRFEVYPSLQKYNLSPPSFYWTCVLFTAVTSAATLVSLWVTLKTGSEQKSWQTNRCYSHPLPSPGPPSPWSTGNSRWCHVPVHVCMWERKWVWKRKHHLAFTESKLLQLKTDVPAWGFAIRWQQSTCTRQTQSSYIR